MYRKNIVESPWGTDRPPRVLAEPDVNVSILPALPNSSLCVHVALAGDYRPAFGLAWAGTPFSTTVTA